MAKSLAVVLAILVLVLTTLLTLHRGGEAAPAPATITETRYRIIPGLGVNKCSLGMPVQRARDLFGQEDAQDLFDNKEDGYLQFYQQGVDVYMEGGKIAAIFFQFRSKEHMTFDGATDKGIGMWSTIPDVMRAYGKPSKISQGMLTAPGPFAGAHEWALDYRSLGITFTFYDNELVDIRVFAKE